MIDHERNSRLYELRKGLAKLCADIDVRQPSLVTEGALPETIHRVTGEWLKRLADASEEISAIRGGLLGDDDAE